MTSTTLNSVESTNSRLKQTPIAIVGMASIFPQSRNLREYWQNIVDKANCITDVPDNRWSVDDYYDPNPTTPDKTYCKRGGFIPEVDFNPMEFGIPPNQLEVTDISQLLALLVAKEALDDAGCGDGDFDKEHTGVVLGVALARQLTMPLAARLQYPVWEKALRSSGIAETDIKTIIDKIKDSYVDWSPNAFPGMLANVVAGRIANRFDLGGMNCIVDAACASSFGALSMAIAELTSGRANMMLTGGVDTDNSIVAYMCFSKTPAVSPSGNTKPFDVDSDGMMLGEGVGMMVLKRLEDAERDGDRVYAVIKGVGSSSDGRHKSIYAPRPEGQMRALRRAYQQAGFEPIGVGAIEAHGTGTMAGDPAEFDALKEVFGENNDLTAEIALGSVKSQIGHTKAAAGAASLIKTALALHQKVLPPTINITQPHPKLGIEDSPFYLNTETRPWFKTDVPRRAGVSSFGFGGTNYHIVLEEYQKEQQQQRLYPTPQAILIDAPTPEQLVARCQEILQQLQTEKGLAYFSELITESETKSVPQEAARIGFVATSKEDAVNKLQKGINFLQKSQSNWEHPLGIFYRQTGMNTEGKVVALFSGQGSQYPNMGRELAMNFPSLQDTYSRVDTLVRQDGLQAISKAVFPPPTFDEAARQQQAKTLQQTEIAQNAIAAFSTGLYKILQQAGFKPDFTAGHSFGELTALWASGVLNDEDYYFLVKERGQAMATTSEAGAMLAVRGDIGHIKNKIESENIAIANWNSPQQVVLAGDKAEIERLQTQLEQQGYSAVLLPVSAAFHTPQIGHAQAPFAKAIDSVTFKSPQIPVFTNVSGIPYPNEPKDCQKILKKHLLSQVSFQEEIENIYSAGGTYFVEFGPRSILTHLVKEILGDRPHLAVALNPSRQKDSDLQLREAVVQLRVAGLNLINFDPYRVLPGKLEAKHPLSVKLTSVNYVSDKTKEKMARSLRESGVKGHGSVGTFHRTSVQELGVKRVEEIEKTKIMKVDGANNSIAKSQHNGYSPQLATTNEVSITSMSANNSSKPKFNSAIALERILGSLEHSLNQFHQHQQETLEVHRQYLDYQGQYAQTFWQLMQQQHQLWTTVQTSSQQTEVKTAVIASAQSSIMKFQEHQNNTLRVHEQYLNHQAKYAQNFFLLTQQSYSQLFDGFPATDNSTLVDTPLAIEPFVGQNGIALHEALSIETSNGNGHHSEALETAYSNGNGHYLDAKSLVPSYNGNGHHAKDSTTTVNNGNGYHQTTILEENIVNGNGDRLTTALEENVVNGNGRAIAAEVAAPTAPPEIDFESLSQTLLNVVSEKTGYPAEMLELDMDMEADLGIDSIKRVEILGALQEEIPDLPQVDIAELAELRTLEQIIEYMRSFDEGTSEFDGQTTESKAKAETATEDITLVQTTVQPESIAENFLAIVSDQTGYPVSSLYVEMNLEEDLGIDLVKRREIFDALQDRVSVPTEIQQANTLAQILDYLNDPTQKKTLTTAS